MHDYLKTINTTRTELSEDSSIVNRHPKATQLVKEINDWHANRTVPERWKPSQLGRLAAQFSTTRELMANALTLAKWTEKLSGSKSQWYPPVN